MEDGGDCFESKDDRGKRFDAPCATTGPATASGTRPLSDQKIHAMLGIPARSNYNSALSGARFSNRQQPVSCSPNTSGTRFWRDLWATLIRSDRHLGSSWSLVTTVPQSPPRLERESTTRESDSFALRQSPGEVLCCICSFSQSHARCFCLRCHYTSLTPDPRTDDTVSGTRARCLSRDHTLPTCMHD